jgi:hypothetical protein
LLQELERRQLKLARKSAIEQVALEQVLDDRAGVTASAGAEQPFASICAGRVADGDQAAIIPGGVSDLPSITCGCSSGGNAAPTCSAGRCR